MAKDDEYELLPKQEIDALKKEVERLRKHPLGDLKEGETLLDAINNLNDNIKKLIEIFTKAEADLAKQYVDSSPVGDLKTIKDQNEQIAQGLVTVADLVKDMKESSDVPPIPPSTPKPTAPSTPPPSPDPFAEAFSQQLPPPPGVLPGAGAPGPRPILAKKRRKLFARR